MSLAASGLLLIPYGTATCPEDALRAAASVPADGLLDGRVPAVAVDLGGGVPLRLNSGAYAFPEAPDLIRLTTLDERLDFLRDHLTSLCGLWDRLPRLFLDVYFRWIAATIEANRAHLATAAEAAGGLFEPRDWSFSALRPLPQAHLPAPREPSSGLGPADRVRVDHAFWTGAALVAVELVGSASRTRARQEEVARLRRHGVTVLEIAGSALQRDGARCLDAMLPPSFHAFWEGQTLPASPFGPALLDEILVEPDGG